VILLLFLLLLLLRLLQPLRCPFPLLFVIAAWHKAVGLLAVDARARRLVLGDGVRLMPETEQAMRYISKCLAPVHCKCWIYLDPLVRRCEARAAK